MKRLFFLIVCSFLLSPPAFSSFSSFCCLEDNYGNERPFDPFGFSRTVSSGGVTNAYLPSSGTVEESSSQDLAALQRFGRDCTAAVKETVVHVAQESMAYFQNGVAFLETAWSNMPGGGCFQTSVTHAREFWRGVQGDCALLCDPLELFCPSDPELFPHFVRGGS